MGWDYLKNFDTSGNKIQEYFDNRYSPIKSAIVDDVYYAAYKLKQSEKIICLVIPFEINNLDDYNFGYKVMDSSVHPYYYDVPKDIFALLSVPETDFEKDWFIQVRKLNNR